MYVCICNAITDKQILEAAERGVSDVWTLQNELGVATNCGSCVEAASELLREAAKPSISAGPRLYQPALA